MEKFRIDTSKLNNKLREIDDFKREASIMVVSDPTRGLRGDLLKKMIAGLAGHRSGNMSESELQEVAKIQSEYDKEKSSDKHN